MHLDHFFQGGEQVKRHLLAFAFALAFAMFTRETNGDVASGPFPMLGTIRIFSFRVLIGSLHYCVCCDWSNVITS